MVEWRIAGAEEWRRAPATNGQYTQGSGGHIELKGSQSVTVPLAVPLEGRPDAVTLRITTTEWKSDQPAELYVRLSENRRALDARRANVIEAAFPASSPFWQHVAENYADAVVIYAMLKLVTVDNAPLAGGVARVLARQPRLPEQTGGVLAPLLALWLPRYGQPGHDRVGEELLNAGLKTQNESVRRVVLELLRDSPDATVRGVLIDALRLSSGDEEWLQRTRGVLIDLLQGKSADPKLTKQAQNAVDWIESRLKHLEEEKPKRTSKQKE